MKSVLGLALICSFLLGAGHVETRDGKVYQGNIAFEDGAVMVAPDGGAAPVRIGRNDVRAIEIRDFAPQPLVGSDKNQPMEPWASADIGNVHVAGSTACDPAGAVTIDASGWGTWGDGDSLHWTYRPLEGDGQIIARVHSTDQSHGPLIVGVMIRQDLKPDSNMITACLNPAGDVSVRQRSHGEIPPASAAIASESKGETWLRMTRRGNVFTVYFSIDGKNWRYAGSRTMALPTGVLAGVAAWSTVNTSRGQALLDSIAVITGTAGTAVSITADGMGEGVVMRDGSVRAGVIGAADDSALMLKHGGEKTAIPLEGIAWIMTGESTTSFDDFAGKTGVLLRNGDFIEGKVTAIGVTATKDPASPQRKVSLNSVVFGIKEIDLREAAAILLGDVAPSSAHYQVKMADGSVRQGNAMEIKKSGVTLDGAVLEDVTTIKVRE